MLILSAIMLTASYSGFRHPTKLSLVAKDSYLTLLHGIHPCLDLPGMTTRLCGTRRNAIFLNWRASKKKKKRQMGRQMERIYRHGDQVLIIRRGCPKWFPKFNPRVVAFILTALWFWSSIGVNAETGYDCSNVKNPVATFSLEDVAPCVPFKSAYKDPEATNVQILQRTSNSIIRGFQCKLVINRKACKVITLSLIPLPKFPAILHKLLHSP